MRMAIRRKSNIFLATCIILIFLLLSWRLRGSNINLLPQSQQIHLDNSTPPPPPHPPPAISTSTSTTTTTNNITRTLILARLSEEITLWADELAESDPTLSLAIYTVDIDPTSNITTTNPGYNHTVPLNKGHEAMVYLTYIIDHYDDPNLADVSIFMHSHLRTWHNNDFLDSSSATMVSRLRSSHVLKTGT